MTIKNPYLVENKKPVEIVYELKSEIPSFEEFARNYEADKNITISYHLENQTQEKGYGPCQNTWCGCDCSKHYCDCPTAEGSIYKKGAFSVGSCSASGNAGMDNCLVKANGQVSHSLIRLKDWSGDGKILSNTLGVDIGRGEDGYQSAKVKASLDVLSLKTGGSEIRVGPNFELGYKQDAENFEFNTGVVGITLGKQIGVSTFFGEVKVDKDKCIIQ